MATETAKERVFPSRLSSCNSEEGEWRHRHARRGGERRNKVQEGKAGERDETLTETTDVREQIDIEIYAET